MHVQEELVSSAVAEARVLRSLSRLLLEETEKVRAELMMERERAASLVAESMRLTQLLNGRAADDRAGGNGAGN